MEKNPTILMVAAVALVRGDGAVLVQQRPAGGHHAGLWEFPGGKIEAGETARAAAVRELREELAIALRELDLVPVGSAVAKEASGRGIEMQLFAARQWYGEPELLDAAAFAWADAAGLAKLAMPQVDIPLARRLGEMLSAGAL